MVALPDVLLVYAAVISNPEAASKITFITGLVTDSEPDVAVTDVLVEKDIVGAASLSCIFIV